MIKEKDELVSIIVLTYKKFDNIENNLYSIFNQEYSNIEIVIADDASENYDLNRIENIFKKRTQNIDNIKVIRNAKNLGIVRNFNNAIKNSRGKYIFPLAQDDTFYDSDCIKKIVDSLKNCLVTTGIRVLNNNNKIECPNCYERDIIRSEYLYKYLLLNGNFISGASTYYKKEIFEKYGYFDEEFVLVEDYPFYLKILRNNEKINFIDSPLIKYKEGGVSGSRNEQFEKDIINILKKESSNLSFYLKRVINFKIEKSTHKSFIKKTFIKFKYIDVFLLGEKIRKKLYKYL